MPDDIYAEYEHITWADVVEGDEIYIDNWEGGKFPQARPKIGGPYRVTDLGTRRLQTTWPVKRHWETKGQIRSFMHWPNNLLRKPSPTVDKK